jgi:DNA-binding PadR family transcriptional regulator
MNMPFVSITEKGLALLDLFEQGELKLLDEREELFIRTLMFIASREDTSLSDIENLVRRTTNLSGVALQGTVVNTLTSLERNRFIEFIAMPTSLEQRIFNARNRPTRFTNEFPTNPLRTPKFTQESLAPSVLRFKITDLGRTLIFKDDPSIQDNRPLLDIIDSRSEDGVSVEELEEITMLGQQPLIQLLKPLLERRLIRRG